MPAIAILGASGAIGRSVGQALRSRGTAYRVVGRDRNRLVKGFSTDPLAEIATWNPDDPASVRAAAKEVETLIYLVGVPYNHFELHPEVIRKTLAGAVAEGVKRFVADWHRLCLRKPHYAEGGRDALPQPCNLQGENAKSTRGSSA